MNHFPRRTLCSAISGLGLTLLCSGVHAQTSAAPELDMTITVMEAGETPAGFINRLELPALETLEVPQASTAGAVQAEVAAEVSASVTEIADTATQVGADSVREVISIDGTTNVSTGGGVDVIVDDLGNTVISLPENIVNILDPVLPLQDSLQDTLDQVGGGLGDVVDGLDVSGTADTVTDVVDSLGQSLPTGGAQVLGDIEVTTELEAIVDSLEPVTAPVVDETVQNLLDDQAIPLQETLPELPDEEPLPVDDFSDGLRELPLL